MALLLLIFSTLVNLIFAQQKELFEHEKEIEKIIKNYNKLNPGWNVDLSSSVTVTQTAYENWAAGGSNVFVWTAGLDGSAIYDTVSWNWANDGRIKYGNSRQNGHPIRKTDDIIDIESVFTYKEKGYLNPYVSAHFSTQMAPGYKYTQETKEEISNFLDPAYLTNGIGIGYSPRKTFRTRIGLAGRTIFTDRYKNYAEGSHILFDSGLQWVTSAERNFKDNIKLRSRLHLFSPFDDMKYSNITWETRIQVALTKYIIVNMQTHILYDKKISPRTQLKEVLSVGLSYKFI